MYFSLVLASFVTAGLQCVTVVKIANIWGKVALLWKRSLVTYYLPAYKAVVRSKE